MNGYRWSSPQNLSIFLFNKIYFKHSEFSKKSKIRKNLNCLPKDKEILQCIFDRNSLKQILNFLEICKSAGCSIVSLQPAPVLIATNQEKTNHFEKKTSDKDSRSERAHQKFGNTRQYLSQQKI